MASANPPAPERDSWPHERPDAAPRVYHLQLPPDAFGLRFDQALARSLPDYSRSRLRAWIDDGRVTVDGNTANARYKVRGGEAVVVRAKPDPQENAYAPQAIALRIVHEDDVLLVIDKPAGLVVHPGSGNWEGTLLNALLHHAPALAAVPRAGIVHRLDKDTSGLLVVAKTLTAQTLLIRQLQARTVHREYLALVNGDVHRDGSVDAPIGRHPTRRTTMAVVATGKPARTHYRVVERLHLATLLECRLETGRTHQIRVHLASIGHPLIGDPAYGRKRPLGPLGAAGRPPRGSERLGSGPAALTIAFTRQALHAARLGLAHPLTGASLQWSAPLPDDFSALLERLRAQATSY